MKCVLKNLLAPSLIAFRRLLLNISTRFSFVMGAVLFSLCALVIQSQTAQAFDFKDIKAVGTAYAAHLFLHEVGHQIVADDVGASASQMSFFTRKNGRFYPGVSTFKEIPKESILPYAAGGERLAGYTFEYALFSHKKKPETFNKALMFFSCADFLVYTFLANYVNPDETTFDPNLIREETGSSKEMMLSMAMIKSLVNTYRIFNQDANIAPLVWVDKDSAVLMFQFGF